jgi:hypothetical protein
MIKDHKVYQSIKDESILSDVILNEKFQEFKETNKYKEMMTKRRFTKNNNIDMLNKLEEQYSRQAILKLNELQYEQAHKNGFNLLDTTDQDFLSKKQEIEDAGGEIVDIPLSKFVFFVKNPSDTITLYRGVADQTKGETENYIKEGLPERSVDIYNKYSLDYIKSPEFLEEYTPARENDDPRISFAVITTSDRGIASGYSRDLPDGDDSSYFYEFEIPKELGIFYTFWYF